MDNIPNANPNPLNTGNGDQANLANIPAVQQVNNPAPAETPHPIMPQETTPPATPLDLDKKLESELAQIPEDSEKKAKMKKYLIAAIAAVLFLTIGFVAYSFFTGDDEEAEETEEVTEETSSLTESLGEESEEEENSSNPPGMVINLESSKPISSEETSTKIER